MSSLMEKLEQKACEAREELRVQIKWSHYEDVGKMASRADVSANAAKRIISQFEDDAKALVAEAIDGIRERFRNAHVAPFGWLKNLENLEKEVLHVLEGEKP